MPDIGFEWLLSSGDYWQMCRATDLEKALSLNFRFVDLISTDIPSSESHRAWYSCWNHGSWEHPLLVCDPRIAESFLIWQSTLFSWVIGLAGQPHLRYLPPSRILFSKNWARVFLQILSDYLCLVMSSLSIASSIDPPLRQAVAKCSI